MRLLRLFPDTNLFLQCKELSEIDWCKWSDFDEIHLVVCHVVQREIDRAKFGSNDRRQRRARKAASIFRKIIVGAIVTIRPDTPRVQLLVNSKYSHISASSPELDYTIPDNELVGTVYSARNTHKPEDVRLLTADTFPLSTALGLGMEAEIIPDEWLLPPVETPQQKRIKQLEAEMAVYQAQEPKCSIECVDAGGNEVSDVVHERSYFPPLSETEVNELVRRLQTAFPVETDFGASEPDRKTMSIPVLGGLKWEEEYIPATEEQIEKYRTSCTEWLDDCRTALLKYHNLRQQSVQERAVRFHLRNAGSRPATDALVTFEAKGDILLGVSDNAKDTSTPDTDETSLESQFRKPPIAPRGKWTSAVAQLAAGMRNYQELVAPNMSAFHVPDLAPILPESHDRNAFYYKDSRPSDPQKSFSLECDQWRHGEDVEKFDMDVVCEGQGATHGAVVCRIEASNLSQSVTALIPVRITIRRMDTFEFAKQEIDIFLWKAGRKKSPFGTM